MKKLSIITLLLAFALTGCAGIQFKAPALDEVVTGAGPRLVGFFIGKNNPEHADKIISHCDLLASEGDPFDFKAKLDEGIDWLLNKYINEPYIVMELENLLPEIQIQTTEIPTPAWMEKVKPLIENFRTGIKFGAASVKQYKGDNNEKNNIFGVYVYGLGFFNGGFRGTILSM